MTEGNVTISKKNGAHDHVAIKIRLDDRSVTANMSFDDFAQALLGRSDVPCTTEIRKGGFHGTVRQNTKEQ